MVISPLVAAPGGLAPGTLPWDPVTRAGDRYTVGQQRVPLRWELEKSTRGAAFPGAPRPRGAVNRTRCAPGRLCDVPTHRGERPAKRTLAACGGRPLSAPRTRRTCPGSHAVNGEIDPSSPLLNGVLGHHHQQVPPPRTAHGRLIPPQGQETTLGRPAHPERHPARAERRGSRRLRSVYSSCSDD